MKVRIPPAPLSTRQVLGILSLVAILVGALLLIIFTPRTPPLTGVSRPNSTVKLAAPLSRTPSTPSTGALPITAIAAANPTTGQADSHPRPLDSPTPQLPLSGRRIALDPGHGPRGDLGAVLVDPSTGNLILSEADFNLDVAMRCRDILRARGASVVLTRENNTTFTAPWPADANGDGIVGGPKDDLQERVDIINSSHAEVFLSIHANNAPQQTGTRGVQVFYCSTPDCAFQSASKHLGQLVLSQLQAKLASVDHPVQSAQLHSDEWLDGLHLFLLGPVNPPTHVRATQMPGVLSESLYLTSPREAAQLQQDNVRQAIALAYSDALQTYLTDGSNGQP